MATNRIIQAVYDLKDNITAKLTRIGDALRSNRGDSSKTADAIERDNKRASDSYKKTADSIGGFRKALVALAGFVGLSKLKDGLIAILETGDKFELLGKRFEVVFGGLEQGSAALEKIKQLAKETPQTLDEVANAAVKLKAFGLDPLDGTLQALIDQNAKLGGSNEDLQNTILAVGQAWTKQKLQGDDIRQLLEKGVPVYDLLAKATGKTAQEIQKMASAGLLGRDAIRSLVTEMGRSADGAAAAQMKTLTGLVSNLRDTMDDFLVRIANAGAIDFFKAKLTDLGDSISKMSASGKLQEIASSVSNAIVGTGKAVAASIKFVYDYSGALILLAKAYALVKVQAFLDGMAAVAAGTTKASGAVRLLSTAILAIPAIRLAVIGGAAVALAANNLRDLGAVIGNNLPATEKWSRRVEELRAEILKGSEVFRVAAERVAEYRNEQLLTAEAAAKLSSSERAAQAERYEGLEKYLQLQIRYYEQLKAVDGLNEDGLKYLNGLKEKLSEVGGGYEALANGAKIAGDALTRNITIAAVEVTKSLTGIAQSSVDAKKKIAEAFGDFDRISITGLGDLALAMQDIGEESDIAGQRVRAGLAEELKKLSGADLLKFQAAATAAFEEVGRSGEDAAVVLDTTLQVALDRLKVNAADTGVAFTQAGKDILLTFDVIATNATATAGQIKAAFDAAIGSVKTREEAEALGAALEAAAKRGTIGAQQTEQAMIQLRARIREIAVETDPLGDAFARLGVKSQRALNATRDSAKEAFDEIVAGAREGLAAQEDVAAAFAAYAGAERAAAANSNALTRARIEQQLELKAVSLGLADTFEKTGAAGAGAGKAVADGFDDARQKIEDAAQSAGDLSDSAGAASEGLQSVADSAGRASSNIEDVGVGLGYMTARALEAVTAARGFEGIDLALSQYKDEIFATREELDAFTRSQKEAADAAADASDELAKLTEKLREQRDAATLDDSEKEKRRYEQELARIQELSAAAGNSSRAQAAELRGLAEAEHRRRLAEIAEEAAAKREANRQTATESSQAGGLGSSGDSGSSRAVPRPGASQGSAGAGGVTYAPTININGGFDLTNSGERKKLALLLSGDLKRALDEINRRAA